MAHRGHDDVVKLLLRGRADVAETELWNRGKTARSLAAQAGHVNIVRMLDNAVKEMEASKARQEEAALQHTNLAQPLLASVYGLQQSQLLWWYDREGDGTIVCGPRKLAPGRVGE
eukprot:GEMP01047704.1.p3 GENE.GEMP01047704.1~~GEMP01047704.1.p3  ORF type:complete len:115 (+),score=32.33 GEMP01047704.1:126-470(+)